MRASERRSDGKKSRVSGLDQKLERISRAIERFRIDGMRFLAGDLHIPPEELKESISAELRKIRVAGVRGVAESFRLSSLEAKFNSQVDLFGRRLRAREQSGLKQAAAATVEAPDPARGVLVGRKGDTNAVEVLYKGLFLESGKRNPSMDLEKFRSYIHRQAETIRTKTGCDNIQFRVAVEDGKMKIKARPVKD